jgi:nicotinamidase-related amidase
MNFSNEGPIPHNSAPERKRVPDRFKAPASADAIRIPVASCHATGSFVFMMRWFLLFLAMSAAASAGPLPLSLRSRTAGSPQPAESEATWDTARTAILVCDMWDDHWCRSAARRVTELAGPMNEMLKAARAKGIFIIHAPSSVTDFYKDSPQRKLAQQAASAKTPVPLATAPRWGTAWCWTDPRRESVLPVDDSDMGCSCTDRKCEIVPPWKRQHPLIELKEGDALTDDGQETWNLLAARGIDHVILCGVHLNMCVLGRPFGIRQQVYLGKKVTFLRDMTDSMYNPERPPGVDHFAGHQLIIEHVERHWCPSTTSTAITGKLPFRFKEDTRPAP